MKRRPSYWTLVARWKANWKMPASEQRVITETTTHLDGSLTTGNLRYYFSETSVIFGSCRVIFKNDRLFLNMLWQNRSIWRQLLRFPETLQIPRVNFRYRWCSEKIRRSFKVVLLSSIMRAWFERSRSITKIHSNVGEWLTGLQISFCLMWDLEGNQKKNAFQMATKGNEWICSFVSKTCNIRFSSRERRKKIPHVSNL